MANRIFAVSIVIVCVMVYSCSRSPYAETNKNYKKQAKLFAQEIRKEPATFYTNDSTPKGWIGTTNFSIRKPSFVIIHHTAQNSCAQTLKTFTVTRTQVSAHYVICKNGAIHHMLNDYLRAWHAGAAKWGGLSDVNSASIGIEIDNDGFECFTDLQMNSLLLLLDTLKTKYNIPAANFIGHSDIAPKRKVDPNIFFSWKALAERGFGLWYSDTTGVTVPENFNSVQALRIVGYDVADSSAAIRAFKRHFVQDTAAVMYEPDKKILFDLMRKSM